MTHDRTAAILTYLTSRLSVCSVWMVDADADAPHSLSHTLTPHSSLSHSLTLPHSLSFARARSFQSPDKGRAIREKRCRLEEVSTS